MNKVGWISLIVFSLIAIAILGLNWYAPRLIDQQLQEFIQNRELDIQYDELKVNLFTGRMALHKVFVSFPMAGERHHHTLKNNINAIDIKGIRWWKLLMHQNLHVHSITLDQPNIVLQRDSLKRMTKEETEIQKDTAQKEQSDFHAFASLIVIKNGAFCLNNAHDSIFSLSVDTINLEFHNTSYHAAKPISVDIVEHFNFDIRCFLTTDKKDLHNFNVEKLVGNSQDSTLQIYGLDLIPRYSESAFSRHISQRTSRMELIAPFISFEKVRYPQMFQNHFYAQQMRAPNLYMRVYKDANVPHNEKQYKWLPHRAFARVDTKITVDTLKIEDAYVRYTELFPERTIPGYVDFQQMDMVFANISNDSAQWAKNDRIIAEASCMFYGYAPLQASFQFPMQKDPWTYYYQGTLRNFNMQEANRILEQAALMQFKTGFVDELSFQVTADPKVATGKIEFFFKNLDVAFIDKERDLFKKFLDVVVEWIAFPQENIKTEKHRIGKVYFERDTSRSIFNHFWKAIFSGMRSTILPNIVLSDELKHTEVEPLDDESS